MDERITRSSKGVVCFSALPACFVRSARLLLVGIEPLAKYLMHSCLPKLFLAALVLLVVAGCGRGNVEPPGASDPAKAKAALTQALDAWRSGAKPDSVSGVIVSDEEWAGGAQLMSYELQGEGKTHGNSIRQRATLEVRGADGKALRKTALYQVATNPTTTITRSDALEEEAGSGTAVRRERE
jgi:hypothetical protein